MTTRLNYLRLFGLLALLLPLYGGVRLWLLSEPITRVEVRTVPEPVEVPVEVQVPVDRVIFVPVLVPGDAATVDSGDESTDDEPGGGPQPLFALPSPALFAQLETTPADAAPVAGVAPPTPDIGASEPAPAAPTQPAPAPPPIARAARPPPPPPVISADQPLAPGVSVPAAVVVPPSPPAPVVVILPPVAVLPANVQVSPVAAPQALEIQSATPPQTLPETPKHAQPADVDEDQPVTPRTEKREKKKAKPDDQVAKREADDKDDDRAKADDDDRKRRPGTSGDDDDRKVTAASVAPRQGRTPPAETAVAATLRETARSEGSGGQGPTPAVSARAGASNAPAPRTGAPPTAATSRAAVAPANPERGNRPSATPASNSRQASVRPGSANGTIRRRRPPQAF